MCILIIKFLNAFNTIYQIISTVLEFDYFIRLFSYTIYLYISLYVYLESIK